MEHQEFTRRSLLACAAATAGVALVGCGRAQTPEARVKRTPEQKAASPLPAAAMTVYRDPNCSCCEAWAGIARNAGYQVNLEDRPDMPAIKAKYGVPDELLSCHTTVVGGYVLEGHVPLEDVQRLLKDRPADVRGIAVAGMPIGSPGMEAPDGTSQPFEVRSFDAAGRTAVFRA